MDITFHTGEGRFNYRVCAIFYQNKVLAMRDERSPTTTCPAGSANWARQPKTPSPAGAPGVSWISPPAFQRPPVAEPGLFHRRCRRWFTHELCLYFLMDAAEPACWSAKYPFTRCEAAAPSRNLSGYPWKSCRKKYFYPLFLRRAFPTCPAVHPAGRSGIKT